ncbi:uncharacterized protein LOC110449226 [Mizuhopecten yessoensis]|uniref:Deoxyribonuclease TATDN1 n=1 Tax=Mizuhopecten yessoensis TaxID=6573 RepID=A0A210QRP7_MIZYE|nr:uncharacterized protein LOC110449226 [Mizuhopecten yessoensis]XP_021351624.1 uncharacterized protein LOC110449226 [Mizuhopecten yessoensis]OWF51410.1 Tat-linked quality control protein TatD [Mizuhopecten yessoensis]
MNWGLAIYYLFICAITTVIGSCIILFVFERKYVIYLFHYYKNIIQFYRSAGKWRNSIDEIVTQQENIQSYASYIICNLGSDVDEPSLRRLFTASHDRQPPEANIAINIAVDSKNPSLRKAFIRIPYHCAAACDIPSFNNKKLSDRKMAIQEVKKRKDLLRKDFKWVSPKPNVTSVSERVSDNKIWNTGVFSEYLLIDGGNRIMDVGSKIVPGILENSDEAGIQRMVLTCSCFKQIKQATKLCEQYQGYMYFTAGVHPSKVDQWDEDSLAVLETYAEHSQCLAIGECGLDLPGTNTEKEIKMFRQQIELACKLRKPLWFCSIGADNTLIPILREYSGQLKAMCVGEYIPSKVEKFLPRIPQLWELLDMGCFVSVSSISKEASGYEKSWFKDWLKKGFISPHKIILASNAPSTLVPNIEYEEYCSRMKPDEIRYLKESTVNRYESNSSDDLDSDPGNLAVLLEIVASCMDCPPKNLASAAYQNAREFFNFR